jgi:hypothetical protein
MALGNTTVAPKRSAKSIRLDNCYIHIFTPRIYQVCVNLSVVSFLTTVVSS